MSRRPNFHGFPASSAALPRVIKHGRSKDFSKGGQTVTIVMITTTPCFISNARRDGGGIFKKVGIKLGYVPFGLGLGPGYEVECEQDRGII